jgi:hypothetical protein
MSAAAPPGNAAADSAQAEPAVTPHALVRLWQKSFTSVRLDLLSRRSKLSTQAKRPRRRRLFWMGGGDSSEADSGPPRALKVGGLDFSSASVRVMQMWELGPVVAVAPGKQQRRVVDFGCGAIYAAETGEMQPTGRLRVRLPLPLRPDAVLRVAPNPELCVKVNVPLSATGLRLGARLSLPWTNESFDAVMTGESIPWRPAFSCRLFSGADQGLLRFSARGVELAERSLALGADTALRCAASVDFPSAWPMEEGDDMKLRLDKLALKTRLRYHS